MNFIEKCVNGEANASDIYDCIAQWHNSTSDGELHEFLGMTETEYAMWVENVDMPYKVRSEDKKAGRYRNRNGNTPESLRDMDSEYFVQAIVLSRKRDASVIPKGTCCYSYNVTRGGQTQRVSCPYLFSRLSKDRQNDGYCAFLQTGDWDGGTGPGLWDANKACGINEDEDEAEVPSQGSQDS